MRYSDDTAFLTSLAALAISIVSANGTHIGNDTILLALVTILLGWNLYNVSDFRKKTKIIKENNRKFAKKLKEIQAFENQIMANMNVGLSDIYGRDYKYVECPEYKLLHHKLSAIKYFAILKKYSECNGHASDLIKTFEDDTFKFALLTDIQKHNIQKLYDSIPNKDDIADFNNIGGYIAIIRNRDIERLNALKLEQDRKRKMKGE